MISSIIQNVRNWFGKIGNGTTNRSAEAAVTVSAKDLTAAESKSRRTDSAEALSSQPLREDSRPRPRRRRRTKKRRSPSSNGDTPSATAEIAPVDPWTLADFQVLPAAEKFRFHDLNLPDEIMHAIQDLGFQYCTPIQAGLLPQTLQGADAAGRAQTGTGKSAVFLLSILTQVLRNPLPDTRRPGTPRALILAPTRELALQIEKDGKALSKYLPTNVVAVFGGMDYEKQKRLLTNGPVDIVVATPGRLLDFNRQGDIRLDKTEMLIIDEADRMLDMGFIPDVQRIIRATPPKSKRQTMLFSATLTPEVTRFAAQWTRDPVTVEIEPEQVAVDTVEQMVYITTMEEKFPLLYNMITKQELERVIVFGNRRDQTRHLTERLQDYGISSALLSGEVAQNKRIHTLEAFRAGKIRVLVATDVAARGLHIEGVSHVVNYNLPLDPEDYVHRIGRTGRAGASGISVSFASEDDAFQIPTIEKFLGRELHCVHPEEEWLTAPPPPAKKSSSSSRKRTPARKPERRQGSSARPRSDRRRHSTSSQNSGRNS